MFLKEDTGGADFATELTGERLVHFSVCRLVLRQCVVALEALSAVVAQELPQAAVDVVLVAGEMRSQLRLVRTLHTDNSYHPYTYDMTI